MKRVLVSGKFDPPHEGHIDHILKADELGDFLIVIVQPDDGVRNVKGSCAVPFYARATYMQGILNYFGIKGDVFMGLDRDGKSTDSLRHFLVKGDIFAKGGDRAPENMPASELKICKELGIEIVYGAGDLLNASSRMEVKTGE